MELFILALLIFFAYLIAKSSSKKKLLKQFNNPTKDGLQKLTQRQIHQLSKFLTIEQLNIKTLIYQAIESMSIMDSSPNLDTVTGRYEFIFNNTFKELVIVQHWKEYISLVQLALDEYRETYYNSIINQEWIGFLTNPTRANLDKFYGKCIIQTFERIRMKQISEIAKLQREEAKIKRRNKIEDTRQAAIMMITNLQIDENEKINLLNAMP